jgi:pentatricopeptide repeat protein
MRPDCISYSILLNTYAQKMMIDEAERILWEMVDDYTVHGNKAAEPRTRKYITLSSATCSAVPLFLQLLIHVFFHCKAISTL